jgi:hypothetical protein
MLSKKKDLFVSDLLTTAKDGYMQCHKIRVEADWHCQQENCFCDVADSLKKTKKFVTFKFSAAFTDHTCVGQTIEQKVSMKKFEQ